MRDGKIIHICLYQSTSEALNALGLEEQAVTQENVELVRRAIAAVNERDLDGYLSCCIDSVELHTPMDPVGGTYSGREDIKRFFADIEEAAPDFRIEVQRLEATGCDQVLAFTCVSSTGRASGIPMDVETTNLYEFTNGKIRRIRIFFDRSEALKAVGLEE